MAVLIMHDRTGARRRHKTESLAAMQWRLADEVVALGEALRVADRRVEVADALVMLAMRAARELGEASSGEALWSSTEQYGGILMTATVKAKEQKEQVMCRYQAFEIRLVPVDRCIAWHGNPRTRVGGGPGWREFVEHIRTYGLLEPIKVTVEPDDRYRIVSGHRRYAAIREIGDRLIAAQIVPYPFETAIVIYGQAEQLQRPWIGQQIGEIVAVLGFRAARQLLRKPYLQVLEEAYELAEDEESVIALLRRWGPRALRQALRFVGRKWPLDRVIRVLLQRKSIRDLEDRLKGLRGAERIEVGQRLLAEWERSASHTCGTSRSAQEA